MFPFLNSILPHTMITSCRYLCSTDNSCPFRTWTLVLLLYTFTSRFLFTCVSQIRLLFRDARCFHLRYSTVLMCVRGLLPQIQLAPGLTHRYLSLYCGFRERIAHFILLGAAKDFKVLLLETDMQALFQK